jgi:FixJ family two-component response regulator
MLTKPTVFLVVSDEAERNSLRGLVNSIGLQVESFATPEAYLRALDHTRPGCLVLDVDLPGMSGLDLHSELVARGSLIPAIFLSKTSDVKLAVRAMKAHAFDFLLASCDARVLLSRIEQAVRLDADLRPDRAKQQKAAMLLARLTAREREVYELIIAGKANKQIASTLGLSDKTIEFHRAKLKRKLGAKSTAELVRISVLAGPQASSTPAPENGLA